MTAELVDNCDAVIHLAAAVGVKLIVESPVRTIENNVHGTEVVLAAANKKKKSADRLDLRGLRPEQRIPFREDGHLVMGATTKGRWSYACSKAIDEFLALATAREAAAQRRRAALQHRRAKADGPVRDGDPDLRQAGAGGPADHRLR